MRKECDELELQFCRCESDTWAILKAKGKTEPTETHLKKTLDKKRALCNLVHTPG